MAVMMDVRRGIERAEMQALQGVTVRDAINVEISVRFALGDHVAAAAHLEQVLAQVRSDLADAAASAPAPETPVEEAPEEGEAA